LVGAIASLKGAGNFGLRPAVAACYCRTHDEPFTPSISKERALLEEAGEQSHVNLSDFVRVLIAAVDFGRTKPNYPEQN
jgi:hypothetical protein